MQTIKQMTIFFLTGATIGVVASTLLLLGNTLAQQYFG